MAIFSQLDTQTQIDFRRYDYERFNRCVPFQLPADVESRIDTFMKSAGLTTGSLDLIRSVDGEYVFLEVCLNRKISIDADGIIRNCPAMARGFGNVKDVTLRQALSQAGFAELWDVGKDRIEVCRDCEFRYVCTDCRAVISDPSNILSKPARCRYDPYEARWSE